VTEPLSIAPEPEQLLAWKRQAESFGLSLEAYVIRCVEQAISLERAMERGVEVDLRGRAAASWPPRPTSPFVERR
jgi:hypothetical protein